MKGPFLNLEAQHADLNNTKKASATIPSIPSMLLKSGLVSKSSHLLFSLKTSETLTDWIELLHSTIKKI